jgi:ATP-dependent DNA helicase DinG
MRDDLDRFFSADAPFSRLLPNWQARPGQARMARAVAETLREGGVSLIEAGTGTGKTLAYLAPAVLSGKKVIISTGTRTLQDQLFFKDLPLLRKALGVPFQASLLKGRANYLCLHRFDARRGEGERAQGTAAVFEMIREWASGTATGDRSELDRLPDDFSGWGQMSATSEQCLGQRCERYEECFVFRARRAALAADIVVVNHHLFFADLAVRQRGYGEVFPRPDAVIFDEAHQIDQAATQFLGLSLSTGRVSDLMTDIERETKRAFERPADAESIHTTLADAREGLRTLFDEFRDGEGRRRIAAGYLSPQTLAVATGALEGLAEALEASRPEAPAETLLNCAARARNLGSDLHVVLEEEDPERVSWVETKRGHVSLTSAPIELGRIFEEEVISQTPAVLFTSATLASGSGIEGVRDPDFAFVRARLGLPAAARAMAVESPFDYRRQALLYLPRLGVSPEAPVFAERVAEEIFRIVRATGGRAFALFTSYRNLEIATASLRDRLAFPLLVQGEGSRSALLEQFKTVGNAVLLATASFWEGVDVPGPALSCVIVDKLPFASPGEPIEEARIALLHQRGGNPFMDYQLPRAILSLRQGLGRLIRNEADRGILALLDERVFTRSYGRIILSSLPPCPWTGTLTDVVDFFTHPKVFPSDEIHPRRPFPGQA